MAGLSTGLKSKLTITACEVDESGKVSVDTSKSFEVMLNPASFNHKKSICYNKKRTLGQLGSENKFSGVNADDVDFEITIDGTGVVNLPIPGIGSPDVKTQLKQLDEVVYQYEGDEHQTNYVQLVWGSFIFNGRMKSMSIKYTLFKPSGDPLRAQVNLSFSGFITAEEESLKKNDSSPDMSHLIEFKAGDTLPQLCNRIYKDASYYMAVAQFNDITNFRRIVPGTLLHFPPLK